MALGELGPPPSPPPPLSVERLRSMCSLFVAAPTAFSLISSDRYHCIGYSYLVPTTEPENGVLGVVFDSCSFPQQDDAAFLDAEVGAVTRLTVMTGGPKFTDVYGSGGEVDSATVHAVSLAALRKHLGITVEPMHSAIMPWVDCMPQYTVGHSDRVANIKAAALAGWGGHLSVTGSSFHGVGVNDCVLAATKLGKTLVESGRV
jgi:oxygen-dependent protoporphyrinogen oxidase